ncbi:MAG: DNA polymerase III subunit delta [Prevotellaceae bacterium]|jgi:DNA polymerase-3 subunit delta|nr:DNA polymerase III subunit delta [Prevotellaceae bacterium]
MAKTRLNSSAETGRILSDLKKKIYRPVYLLMGEEPYFIDMVSDYMASHILTEEERSFNQLILYGKDISAVQLIETARRFPMMSAQQVIIVREAQQMKDIDLLEVYAKAPMPSTILAICYKGKTVDKRKGFYKTVSKAGEVLETAQLYDNEVAAWVTAHLKEKQGTIDATAGAILVEYLGNDLSKIAHELDKLLTLLPENNKHITREHIERNIGISRDYNVFELNKAISQRNAQKVFRIVQHFAKNPNDNPIVVTLGALFTHFLKVLKFHLLKRNYQGANPPPGEAAALLGVNPYFVRDYEEAARNYPSAKTAEVISLLREYDMRSKGRNNGAADHGELLRELAAKILY